jgi:hypothetical protein
VLTMRRCLTNEFTFALPNISTHAHGPPSSSVLHVALPDLRYHSESDDVTAATV